MICYKGEEIMFSCKMLREYGSYYVYMGDVESWIQGTHNESMTQVHNLFKLSFDGYKKGGKDNSNIYTYIKKFHFW